MAYRESTLPYSLNLDSIKRMNPGQTATAAKEVVRRIPPDEFLGKVSLNNQLYTEASDGSITEFAKANILSFIRAIDDEWQEKTQRK